MFGFGRKRRKKLGTAPFPPEWEATLTRNVPYESLLAENEKSDLRGLVQILLHEKRFEGCAGLDITDEIRVTIAAQACLLLLNRPTDIYPRLRSILVYPDAFLAPSVEYHEDGVVVEGMEARAGESWSLGNIVLSWADVLEGAADPGDGYNPVLHEFAHQLDYESGASEGAPALPDRQSEDEWKRIFAHEYRALSAGRRSPMDSYGAKSPAEFFAVATETFFERPVELKTAHAELYEQLRKYYRQDPVLRLLKLGPPGRRPFGRR
jgi:Mlc titration factor MtfA (ptsG expression regulator)